MSNTQVAPATFSFQSQAIRTVVENGEPWFNAKDVCDVLGYANTRQTIADHCKEKGVTKRYTPSECDVSNRDTTSRARKTQEMVYINEPNLYRLIIKSRKPEAEAFEAWVMEEVLPAIRKTGEYRATINSEQQRAIQEAVNARARRDGTSHQSIYHDLKTRYHIPRYSELPASAFADCLQWLGSERQDRRIFAVRLMERGLRQYHERQDAIRTLSHRVAELGELAHILARELDHTRATLRDLERMGAIYDGLHEAQAHLGFPREILDAGRTEEWQ